MRFVHFIEVVRTGQNVLTMKNIQEHTHTHARADAISRFSHRLLLLFFDVIAFLTSAHSPRVKLLFISSLFPSLFIFLVIITALWH